ncbi:hypothetical protein, partial [Psychrobacillus psychrotolerans]|uniref:hypothetical protein n=1 Tax=Psychrobacillus psychrotolerans TaxID=126156 RepID=UPI003C77E36F
MIRSDEEAEAKPAESDHLRPKSVISHSFKLYKTSVYKTFLFISLKKEPDKGLFFLFHSVDKPSI